MARKTQSPRGNSRTAEVLEQLRRYESRNVTYLDPDGTWPIVWERARGVHVWDAEGRRHLDLTAAFGVAAAGHANPAVVRAGRVQMARLLHAMGDVHPHALKAALARELSRLTFERWTLGGVAGEDRRRPGGSNRSDAAGASSFRSADDSRNRGLDEGAGIGLAELARGEPPGRRRSDSGRVAALGEGANSVALHGKTIFCNAGFEAVEAALKTAQLATKRPGIIAFRGAYHGLGYGALNATHRGFFRDAFRQQLREFGNFVSFPTTEKELRVTEREVAAAFQRGKIGAVLVEPVQARGGIQVPPPEFLPRLRKLCDRHGALLIVDEIYTGFGRTGRWFACEHSATVPDVICLGKALTGGFPLSACVGRADVMDAAWPASAGEAMHTSTFLGHPVGCAMALAQIGEIERYKLPERAALMGRRALEALRELKFPDGLRGEARGVGWMLGLELRLVNGEPATAASLAIIKALLHRGFILLPEGEHANVISFTPPLTLGWREFVTVVNALQTELLRVSRA